MKKRSMSAKNIESARLTPEEIFNLTSNEMPWGIEGYEIQKKYFDYHQSVWQKKRGDILSGKEKRIWPPKDWPRDPKNNNNPFPPHRRSYLDDIYKLCNSFYDPKRAKELIEEKKINTKDYEPPVKIDTKKRNDFLENEKKKEAWRKTRENFVPDYKAPLDDIKDKIKEHNKEREVLYSEKMKRKYVKGKEQMPRCDRVTVVADAEFVGEQIPFYNTPPDANGQKAKKLFNPNKLVTMKRSPSWGIYKPFGKNENVAAVEARLKEKVDEYLTSKNLKKEDLNYQVRDKYYKVTHHGQVLYSMVKDSDWKHEEHHQKAEEDHPKVHPGPDHYWKMPKGTYGQKNPKLNDIVDDNGKKIYYMDRRKTDKRVYLSGMRHAVY